MRGSMNETSMKGVTKGFAMLDIFRGVPEGSKPRLLKEWYRGIAKDLWQFVSSSSFESSHKIRDASQASTA
jgi:hypothetical protein